MQRNWSEAHLPQFVKELDYHKPNLKRLDTVRRTSKKKYWTPAWFAWQINVSRNFCRDMLNTPDHTIENIHTWRFSTEASDGPSVAVAGSEDFYKNPGSVMRLINEESKFTVGQPSQRTWAKDMPSPNYNSPVSAMDICGLLGTWLAWSTFVFWKNVRVHCAASSIATPPNHGCTLAICYLSYWHPRI